MQHFKILFNLQDFPLGNKAKIIIIIKSTETQLVANSPLTCVQCVCVVALLFVVLVRTKRS